ncbi:MAG TPA: hypothetical protein QF753_23310 [Victivallales bacterium]|nr:hypothetical protein [Victivallales bacterium]
MQGYLPQEGLSMVPGRPGRHLKFKKCDRKFGDAAFAACFYVESPDPPFWQLLCYYCYYYYCYQYA